jgi:hypothetical protein
MMIRSSNNNNKNNNEREDDDDDNNNKQQDRPNIDASIRHTLCLFYKNLKYSGVTKPSLTQKKQFARYLDKSSLTRICCTGKVAPLTLLNRTAVEYKEMQLVLDCKDVEVKVGSIYTVLEDIK